jgi:1-acyl-sn-glycerol-3-phosphate acyltransferase
VGSSRENWVQYGLSRVVAGPLLHLLWRPRVIGMENIPPAGGAILASNHLSVVDSIFLPLMLDRPLTFAAKSEYFTGTGLTQRLTGAYMRATNQLSVDRDSSRAAQDMLDAALSLLRRGQLFGIYPEGTRSPDGKLYRGRTGVAWLALAAGVPVIPVAMMGTDRVLPPGRKVPRVHPVSIRIGKPLTFEAYQTERSPGRARRAVTDEVTRAIGELSGQEYVPIYASVRKAQLNGRG